MYSLLESILGRMAFGGIGGREGGSGFLRVKGSETADPTGWRKGEPGAFLPGRGGRALRAAPPSARRAPPPPPRRPHRRRQDTRGMRLRGTRVGPAEPLHPAARKARSGGPRPDSCSGEAAAAGNTKRLIQPREGGREERGGNRGKNRRGRGKKKRGRKKRKETCKIRAGSARRGAGAVLGSPRRRRGPRERPRDRPGLSPPARLGLGSVGFVIPSPPPEFVSFFSLTPGEAKAKAE